MELYDPRYCADLGDGFLVKWATLEEIAAYGALCDVVFRKSEDQPLRTLNAQAIAEWTGTHLLSSATDVAVVVNAADEVVAGAILLRQSMDYAGIQLSVGRPELVVCAAEHRKRGFIRQIFALLHAKSQARGDHLQAITGIPSYYRQFGYSYAIDFDQQTLIRFADIPPMPQDADAVILRNARPDEYGTFVSIYDADRLGRGLLATTPIEKSFYTHQTTSSELAFAWQPLLIENRGGDVVGYSFVYKSNYDNAVAILGLGIRSDQSWHRLAIPILHACKAHQSHILYPNPSITTVTEVNFVLDPEHPMYVQLRHGFATRHAKTYAWYIRVPDYQRLFTEMTPILEARLRRSNMRGHSGELVVSCYGHGFTMVWQDGQIVATRNTRPPLMGEGAHVCLPADTLLMLVFGRKSFAQIKHWHHEAWATTDAEQLLGILFPTQASWFLWLN